MSKRYIDVGESHVHEQPTKITRTVKYPLQQQDDHDDTPMRIQQMLEWLEKLGADFSSVEIAPSSHGGFGAFSRIEIPSNGTIAKIPNQAVMSIGRSKRSIVGQCCHNVFMLAPKKPDDEFILWLDMIHGRRDPNHFHHPYLAALPCEAPDVPSWSPSRRTRLQGTNLGVAAEQAFKELEQQFHYWMPQLSEIHPELFGSTTLSDLMWARGMYFSRRFPTVLLYGDDNTGDGGRRDGTSTSGPIPAGPSSETNKTVPSSAGIMLPFFDLLNHSPHQPITWSGSNTHVTFSTGSQSIPAGSEIYNNYGPKGNEMLLMMYGFALRNNCHDSYGLHLVKMTVPNDESQGNEDGKTLSSAMKKISLGTFQIHRLDSPINPQFPPELWRALNQMFEEDLEETVESTDRTDNHNYNDNGTTTEDDDIEIGLEAIEILLDTLRQRLLPFEATREVDCRLDDLVSIYRDGQRVVLEEAVATLEQMIPESHDTEDEDNAP